MQLGLCRSSGSIGNCVALLAKRDCKGHACILEVKAVAQVVSNVWNEG